MGQAHGQCVVAAGGTAGADAQPRADADEQGADDGGGEGHIRDPRPQGREAFTDGIANGIPAGGNDGVTDEILAQGFPAQQVTGSVQQKAGYGGGNPQPVMQQQRQAENAALRDAGQGVDVVHSEGLKGAAQKGDDAVDGFEFGEHDISFSLRKYTCIYAHWLKMIYIPPRGMCIISNKFPYLFQKGFIGFNT